MVVGKGNDPPHDTGQTVHNQPNHVPGLMLGTGGAENGGLNDQVHAFPENSDDRAETHRVDFKVQNLTNPVHFLYKLLKNLQVVDPTSCLVPSDQAPLALLYLSDNAVFRSSGTDLQLLSSYYLHDLSATKDSPGFRGCFILRCNVEFLKFKEDRTFMTWLKGTSTTANTANKVRISLDKCELPGTKRFPVGFFIHVIAREDLAQAFADLYLKMLNDDGWQAIPPFSVRAYTAYMAEVSCRAFRVIAASEEEAKLVSHMMANLMGAPSCNKISFIPYQTWRTMKNPADKAAYLVSQARFMSVNRATTLDGFRDVSYVFTKHYSTMTWIFDAKSSNDRPLFTSIFQVPTKQVVLYYKHADDKDVQAWKMTVLDELVRFAKCGREEESTTAAETAAEIFMNPEEVYKLVENSHATKGLIETNSMYANFTPLPGELIPQKHTKKKTARDTNLVFDYWTPEDDRPQNPKKVPSTGTNTNREKKVQNSSISVADAARKAALKAANEVISKSQKADNPNKVSQPTHSGVDPRQENSVEQRELQLRKNTLKRAAEEASVAAVNEARRIYDEYDETIQPGFNSTGYNFEVTYDSYGNELPVVWIPSEQSFLRLTEENYLRAKSEVEQEGMEVEAESDVPLNHARDQAQVAPIQYANTQEDNRKQPPRQTHPEDEQNAETIRQWRLAAQAQEKHRSQNSTPMGVRDAFREHYQETEREQIRLQEAAKIEERMAHQMESRMAAIVANFQAEIQKQNLEHERKRKEEAALSAAREDKIVSAMMEMEKLIEFNSFKEVLPTKNNAGTSSSLQVAAMQQKPEAKHLSGTLAYSRVLAGSSQSQGSSNSGRSDGLASLTRLPAATRTLSPSKTTPTKIQQKRTKISVHNRYMAFQAEDEQAALKQDDVMDNRDSDDQEPDDQAHEEDESAQSTTRSVRSTEVSVVTGISGVSGSYHWETWNDERVDEVNKQVKELKIAKPIIPEYNEDAVRVHRP